MRFYSKLFRLKSALRRYYFRYRFFNQLSKCRFQKYSLVKPFAPLILTTVDEIENEIILLGKKISLKVTSKEIEWVHKEFKKYSKIKSYKIPIKEDLNLDIKDAWELGRLYFLSHPQFSKVSILENFIKTQPAGLGVHWMCPMDVGIRAANIVLYSLGQAQSLLIKETLYTHGLFILHHLEYDKKLRANHYLANITGLAWISSQFSQNNETDAWLYFSFQELMNEIEFQFNEDGSNFEASTSYHRLSLEMVLYTVALFKGINPERLAEIEYPKDWPYVAPIFGQHHQFIIPENIIKKIDKALQFTQGITKPNGEIPQIGDNDSGRFFKFNWKTNDLDHRYFENMREVIFQGKKPLGPEAELISYLMSGKKFELPAQLEFEPLKNKRLNEERYRQEKIFYFSSKIDLAKTKIYFWKDFGLAVWKNEQKYISFFCGSIGQNGNGGHAHNDKLSIDFFDTTKDILKDPGTGVYTANSKIRNYFRSTKTHNTLYVEGIEQLEMPSLFHLAGTLETEFLSLEPSFLSARVKFKDIRQMRNIYIDQDRIVINDSCSHPFTVQWNSDIYSPSYGVIIETKT